MNVHFNFNINIDDRIVASIKRFFRPKNIAILTITITVFAAIIFVYAATENGELKIFNPGDRVLAEDVNQNFALLEDGLHNMVPPGTIVPFAGETVPDGWFLCDGADKSKAKYPRLYAAIKDIWGKAENAEGDFKLPDFQGVFLRGYDKKSKVDVENDRKRWDQVDPGNYFGSFQGDAFQKHQHKYGQLQRVQLGKDNGVGYDAENYEEMATSNYGKDGSNDPKFANETRPKNYSVNYIMALLLFEWVKIRAL